MKLKVERMTSKCYSSLTLNHSERRVKVFLLFIEATSNSFFSYVLSIPLLFDTLFNVLITVQRTGFRILWHTYDDDADGLVRKSVEKG